VILWLRQTGSRKDLVSDAAAVALLAPHLEPGSDGSRCNPFTQTRQTAPSPVPHRDAECRITAVMGDPMSIAHVAALASL